MAHDAAHRAMQQRGIRIQHQPAGAAPPSSPSDPAHSSDARQAPPLPVIGPPEALQNLLWHAVRKPSLRSAAPGGGLRSPPSAHSCISHVHPFADTSEGRGSGSRPFFSLTLPFDLLAPAVERILTLPVTATGGDYGSFNQRHTFFFFFTPCLSDDIDIKRYDYLGQTSGEHY
ncbi:hypothetical protein VTJ83DRAFT_186 [Remersonia thermophila]|uniref:Uncharacterized protein n=1 Tax=Remersonia thermophila TaxID=72144 RepID=A0ABR4DKA9_9PEZI